MSIVNGMSKRDIILREIFDYHTVESSGKIFGLGSSFANFWQKSYNHFNIVLLLASIKFDEIGYSYEDICDVYPHKLGSRTTIITILNEGVDNNFFDKRTDSKDHRKQNQEYNPLPMNYDLSLSISTYN